VRAAVTALSRDCSYKKQYYERFTENLHSVFR